jgi:tetratricopeptide (TPR) repeat protein
MVELFGVESPYTANSLTDARGRFRFRDLAPGSYTVTVFVPGRAEIRRTVVASPALAGARKTIDVTIPFPSDDERGATRPDYNTVQVRQLAIPDRARHEYEDAEKQLGKRNREEAVEHLQEAVRIAPKFALAWNSMGVLAYQTQNYSEAERCFRQAIGAQPGMYEGTVNLGGVLLNLKRPEEALAYNKFAVLERPGDALANSQLGMDYFELKKMDQAEQYLNTAKRLDPSHFSHPQLLLAEIYLSRGDQTAALAELKDFLARFPESPACAQVRALIQRITASTGGSEP